MIILKDIIKTRIFLGENTMRKLILGIVILVCFNSTLSAQNTDIKDNKFIRINSQNVNEFLYFVQLNLNNMVNPYRDWRIYLFLYLKSY